MKASWRTALVGLAGVAVAQFPPSPEGVKILKSKLDSDITISYKEPGICETTPGVKSYAGYVHLPPGALSDLGAKNDYPLNTFFWFFEARKDPENAPLAIWLNGGPGSSSMLGLLDENGPCHVNPDSNSTVLNPWSWNNEVNMLYLDQPTQVGFSYDVLANYTANLITGDISRLEDDAPVPQQNTTVLVGTYPSQDGNSTALGTHNAAIAIWHFAQVWFREFPGYHPHDSRVSIATESYGGRYGPAFAAFFEEQNERIANGTWKDDAIAIDLDTLLIINGCVDRRVMWPSYPQQAFNNTYGLKTVNQSVFDAMTDAFTRPGGCRDQIDHCRDLALASDPHDTGANATVNSVCEAAELFCVDNIRDGYTNNSGRNYYDIGQRDPDPFTFPFYVGYLNRPHVQAALGVPLNFTSSNGPVGAAFRSIGDYPRPGWLEDLAYVLDRGVKVALVYGDRDYACNWFGGEAVSLAVPHAAAKNFAAAGYAPLRTNASYEGGQVRQHGNLSFSRVYQAGHEVPSYQPETAYAIFSRVLSNHDVATGRVDTSINNDYATKGPSDTLAVRNELPPPEIMFCYLYDAESTCTSDQIAAVENGSAVVRHWIVKDANSTRRFPGLFDGESGGAASSAPASTSAAVRVPPSVFGPLMNMWSVLLTPFVGH